MRKPVFYLDTAIKIKGAWTSRYLAQFIRKLFGNLPWNYTPSRFRPPPHKKIMPMSNYKGCCQENKS